MCWTREEGESAYCQTSCSCAGMTFQWKEVPSNESHACTPLPRVMHKKQCGLIDRCFVEWLLSRSPVYPFSAGVSVSIVVLRVTLSSCTRASLPGY
eukprot:808809-Rhodomonas_salina.1